MAEYLINPEAETALWETMKIEGVPSHHQEFYHDVYVAIIHAMERYARDYRVVDIHLTCKRLDCVYLNNDHRVKKCVVTVPYEVALDSASVTKVLKESVEDFESLLSFTDNSAR